MGRVNGMVITTEATQVARLARAVVAHDPVQNTVFGTIAEWVFREGAAPFAAHPKSAPLVLVARSQPTTPVTLTDGWDAADQLAGILADLDPLMAALAGPGPLVDAIVSALGRAVTARVAERLFRLDDLVEPVGVEGRARRATTDDLDLLEAWLTDFHGEVFGRPPTNPVRDFVTETLDRHPIWLWLDERNAPRSFALRRAAVHGVSRIGPVYTPPDDRSHGFGSAVTAAVAQDALVAGEVPCLYTDLANQTSNKIYQAIGFVPVSDRVEVRFD